jgi:hypothetical protein
LKVNKKTFLFEDFSKQEADEMLYFARNLIIGEHLPKILPSFVTLWMEEFNYGEDQKYLVLASALPQRILLSLIENSKQN